MPLLGQTITVVNKSGKVVSTSKHLVNVFKEAKSAYRERKAEINAARDEEIEQKRAKSALAADAHPHPTRHSPPSPRSPVSRTASLAGSQRGSRRDAHGDQSAQHHHERRHARKGSKSPREGHHRQPLERGYTDSFFANERPRRRSHATPSSPLRFLEDAEREKEGRELARRRSLDDFQSHSSRRSSRAPRSVNADIDMDLAYGELPPPLPVRRSEEESELKVKVTALQRMLEEANCLQHSAQAMIKNLENNPDAMAAVALTMAEISGLVSKVGPGALMGLKGAFPAVVALLASPEFLIAAGVGVGITVIALGGYKIVKRIKAKKDLDKENVDSPSDELEEIQSDVDIGSIENWRRGIANVEAESAGTSVDGEFITPGAARDLRAQGKLPPAKKSKSSKDKKRTDTPEKEAKRALEKKEKKDRKERKERDERERKDRKREKVKEPRKEIDTDKKREKKESGLALMFKVRRDDGLDKDLLI